MSIHFCTFGKRRLLYLKVFIFKMFFATAIFSLSLGVVLGSNCKDLSGIWKNQLGSNMTLFLRSDNLITGEYSTAVESKLRAALVTSNITGTYATLNDGALLSFNVLFNHGKSLTTWVGQCMVCDGEEFLFTTWNLRSHFLKPQERWMSNRIGQDTFKRMNGDSDIPLHLRTLGPLVKDEVSVNCEKNIGAGGKGQWTSSSGDVFKFTNCFESGKLSGLNLDKLIHGRSAGGGPFTALGFVSATQEIAKGWTGYIHESMSTRRTIEASQFSHSFSNSCKQPRRFVNYGEEDYVFSYTRQEANEQDSAFTRFINYFTSLFKK